MCVFGIYVLKIVVERCFWGFIRLIGSLVELHAWLHSYLCFSILEKRFLSYLNTSLIPPRHLAIYRAFQLFFIAISIASRQLSGSIDKLSGPSIASWQLVDRSRFFIIFFVELSLNRSSIATSVKAFFTKLLYICSARSISPFSQSLSR